MNWINLSLNFMKNTLILGLIFVSFLGCKRDTSPKQGRSVSCRCTYLTDFDDTATIDVETCVEEGRDPQREAAFCALQSAHNHIDQCTCQPLQGPCDPSAVNACINR